MDNKRIEDIERLLQKMREENMQYRENKHNLYSKTIENEEEEEESNLPSRYREAGTSKPQKVPAEKYGNYDSSEEEEEEEEEDSEEIARQRIKKRLDELKTRKTKLGPPMRVKNDQSDEETTRKPPTRPTTAKVIPSYIPSPQVKKRKNDPVALYQQRQKEWKSNSFLRSNTMNTREGRKLNLKTNNHAKNFELNKKKDVHEYIRQTFTAPHEKRRDDVRFQTRVKMMTVNEV